MRNINNSYIDIFLLFLLAILWGSSFTMIKVALVSFSPEWIVLFRMLLGGSLLLISCLLLKKQLPRIAIIYPQLAVQGCLQGILPFTFIAYSEIHIDSGLVGLLNSTPPIFVFLISVFILRINKFDTIKFFGVLLGILGVGLIYTLGGIDFSINKVIGMVMALLASCCYAMSTLYGVKFKELSPFVTAALSLLLGSFGMLLIVFVLEIPATKQIEYKSILAVLYLSIFSTALASLIFFRLLKNLGALASSSNGYLRAIFSLLLGAFLLDEPLGLNILIGTIFIFSGVYLMSGAKYIKRKLKIDSIKV